MEQRLNRRMKNIHQAFLRFDKKANSKNWDDCFYAALVAFSIFLVLFVFFYKGGFIEVEVEVFIWMLPGFIGVSFLSLYLIFS